MAKSKKKPAKKKALPKKPPPKKKLPVKKGIWGVWFEFNFEKGAHPPGSTRGEIETYYRKFLAKWDYDHGEHHALRFKWSIIPGQPEVHHLIGETSPPPVPIPVPHPPPGSTTPPSPPPPPPPSLS